MNQRRQFLDRRFDFGIERRWGFAGAGMHHVRANRSQRPGQLPRRSVIQRRFGAGATDLFEQTARSLAIERPFLYSCDCLIQLFDDVVSRCLEGVGLAERLVASRGLQSCKSGVERRRRRRFAFRR